MSKRMSPALYWWCRAILLLDRAPIPMRWYTIRSEDIEDLGKVRPSWSWKPGTAGVRALIRWKLLFRFAKEHEYRQAVKRSNGQEQDR